ncbi:MAG: T9SS type A sorting domain-containing protein [Crocinitomicaceae bacterium]|nr:T9SS type A sorting domain-containing protein [Crocinitomicaceae bacterium]
MNGSLLKEEVVSSDLVPFDLTGFAKGIYFVELVYGDTVFREKVVLD